MTAPFDPIVLADGSSAATEVRNRVWIAPMCQYSVPDEDGVPTDWHLMHLGQFAAGGAGLVFTEATAVSPEGRISPRDTGIWNGEQADAWARICRLVRAQGATAGIQLAHAGRKGSTVAPWGMDGRGTIDPVDGGWSTVAPSAVPFGDYAVPTALDESGIEKVVNDFTSASTRAAAAGFDVIEIHAAHGYLLHQFLSPLSNTRDDAWGGSLENRARLLLRIVTAVRAAVPDRVLMVRFSGTDWAPDGVDGWNPEDCATVAAWAHEAGADAFDLSSGGTLPGARIPIGPGYQVEFATRVRKRTGAPTSAVGLITDSAQVDEIIGTQRADAVMLAREALRDPHAPLRMARELGAQNIPIPGQYERAY
ncbi:NADH:flavin oxidoreductase/NADH oxidase [Okibacterium endophyticum]